MRELSSSSFRIAAQAAKPIEKSATPKGADPKARLARLDRKISALVELAIEVDDVAAIGAKLRTLKTNRDALRSKIELADVTLDRTAIGALVSAKLSDLGAVLKGSPTELPAAVSGVLGGERLAVFDGAERGFRVEGTLLLDLQNERPQKAESPSGAVESIGSGARSDRLHTESRRYSVRMNFKG